MEIFGNIAGIRWISGACRQHKRGIDMGTFSLLTIATVIYASFGLAFRAALIRLGTIAGMFVVVTHMYINSADKYVE